jgi:hypothetical protein
MAAKKRVMRVRLAELGVRLAWETVMALLESGAMKSEIRARMLGR